MSHIYLSWWEDFAQEFFVLFLKAGQTRVCAVYVLQFVCANYTVCSLLIQCVQFTNFHPYTYGEMNGFATF